MNLSIRSRCLLYRVVRPTLLFFRVVQFRQTFLVLASKPIFTKENYLFRTRGGKRFMVFFGKESISSQAGGSRQGTKYCYLHHRELSRRSLLFSASTLENRTKQETLGSSHPLSEQYTMLSQLCIHISSVSYRRIKRVC